VKPLRIGFS